MEEDSETNVDVGDEEDIESGSMVEMGDAAASGTVGGEDHPSMEQSNVEIQEDTSAASGGATSTQPANTPRRTLRRSRNPPVKFSMECQVVETESEQQKIERGRKLWQRAKARRAAGHT